MAWLIMTAFYILPILILPYTYYRLVLCAIQHRENIVIRVKCFCLCFILTFLVNRIVGALKESESKVDGAVSGSANIRHRARNRKTVVRTQSKK